ncbi:MAG: polysaccharide deacetylase family protein [Proteobacteria bacterium]|nr:polysaccharide deacetylase family protein [Pseudomonadota bacterium]
MKISVLAYHSANIFGNEYHNNDHIALKYDLKIIKEENVQIISAQKLVSWLYGKTTLDNNANYIVLTFDDGNELDFTNWKHPEYGDQQSFYYELVNSNQYVHATAFVIASPIARKNLEKTCLGGYPLLTDTWWSKAEDSKVISIENHSWDHLHPTLEDVKQQNNEKGDFSLINTVHDAKAQIADSTIYIESVLKNKSVSMFAYPYGHYNSFLTDEYFPNHQDKIIAAFTCDPEKVTKSTNVWKIPRYVCGCDWKSTDGLKNIIFW